MNEEKKVFKISLKTLILLTIIIVLLVIIAIMGFMMISLKSYNKEQSESLSQESNNKEKVVENVTSENEVQNKIDNKVSNKVSNKISNKVSNRIKNTTDDRDKNEGKIQYIDKIVDNMAYIYDAHYSIDELQTDSYEAADGNEYSVSEIMVPFINMDSDDAKNVNSEIEELYQKYIDEFKACSDNKNSFIKVDYQTYVTSNIISILITINRGKEDNNILEYITYNFDSISGAKLTYEQVYQIAGINDIEESVKNSINNLSEYDEYKLTDSKLPQEVIDARNSEIEECQSQTYNYYEQDVLNENLGYFLDSNLSLNIVINIFLPADSDNIVKIINIKN